MRCRVIAVSLLTAFCGCLSRKEYAAVQAKRVEVGMSSRAVEMAWGTPCEQSTTQAAGKTFQRWTYCAVCPATKAWLAKNEPTQEPGDVTTCEKQEIVTFTDGSVSSVDSLGEYD